jgi:hypothetical protein
MKNSFSLFFLLLCVCIIPSNTALLSTIQTSHSSTYQSPSTQKQQPSHDEWLDFDDEDEEPATLQSKTRWQRFMGGVDKFALQMKALWAFKIKPWWQEKHGKEITIATASTLLTLVVTWMAYRRYKKVMATRLQVATNPDINPFVPKL